MRHAVALLCIVAFAACGTAVPPPPVAAAPAAPLEDPRIAELERTMNEILDRIEVLNARIQRLESGREEPAVRTESAPKPAQQPAAVTSSAPAIATPPPAAPRPARQPAASVGAQLADDYRNALALYGKSDFNGAREALLRVLEADPNGELADNALYWIGETYFASGSYSAAMKYYRRVFTDFADQNKAPDAMYKMGLAYEKIGDLVLARSTFEELIRKYPYSTPASSARNEVKRIKY